MPPEKLQLVSLLDAFAQGRVAFGAGPRRRRRVVL